MPEPEKGDMTAQEPSVNGPFDVVALITTGLPLASVMIVLLLFSWLWIPVATRLPRFRREMVVRYQPSTSRWNPRMLAAAFDLFAIIVVLVLFYPYLAGQ